MCAVGCVDVYVYIYIDVNVYFDIVAAAWRLPVVVRKARYTVVKPVQEELPDAILFGGRPVDGMEVPVVVFPQELLVNAVPRRLGR